MDWGPSHIRRPSIFAAFVICDDQMAIIMVVFFIFCTGCPRKNTLIKLWTRDHALHLLADIVVLQAVVNAGAVPHFVKLLRSPAHNVCEQVKSMISSPKIL